MTSSVFVVSFVVHRSATATQQRHKMHIEKKNIKMLKQCNAIDSRNNINNYVNVDLIMQQTIRAFN